MFTVESIIAIIEIGDSTVESIIAIIDVSRVNKFPFNLQLSVVSEIVELCKSNIGNYF